MTWYGKGKEKVMCKIIGSVRDLGRLPLNIYSL